MKLHFRTMGQGAPIFILHGVFGSSDNWQSVGKQLAVKYKVYFIDQRNHGLSLHSNEFNYEAMASDIEELMKDEHLSKIILMGHSMGGKTAMYFACLHPEKVEKLIVVDIAPKYYAPHHQEVLKGFRTVQLDTIQTRKEAEDQMATVIGDIGTRQFLLKNLHRDVHGVFSWKANIDVIEKNISEIGKALPSDLTYSGPTLFISGANSNYIKSNDWNQIKHHFPSANLKTVEKAGHWVHAEQPEAFYQSLSSFLP